MAKWIVTSTNTWEVEAETGPLAIDMAQQDLRLDMLGQEYGIPVLSLKEAKLLAERMGQAR